MIYKFFQTKSRVEIWLFENADLRIEGKIIGFDEYMNTVLDEAEEVNIGQSGSGNLSALNFNAENVIIGKSGSGDTSIGVTESFTVGSSGSGNIYYRGNPEKQSIGISGSTKLIKQ